MINRYRHAWILAFIQFICFGYFIAANLQNPIPNKNTATKSQIRILHTNDLSPHLTIQIDKADPVLASFPIIVSPYRFRYYGFENTDLTFLRGCEGEAIITKINLLPIERYRVWELHCNNIHLDFEAAKKDFLTHKKGQIFALPIYIILAVISVFYAYLFDKRREDK